MGCTAQYADEKSAVVVEDFADPYSVCVYHCVCVCVCVDFLRLVYL